MKKVVSSNKKRLRVFIGSLVTLAFVVTFALTSTTVDRYLQQISAYQWDQTYLKMLLMNS